MIHAVYFAPLDSHGGLLVWLFGGGIGTNIGASLIWGFLAGFVGYFVAKRLKATWVRLHEKVDALHGRHDQHEANHAALMQRIEALNSKLDGREC